MTFFAIDREPGKSARRSVLRTAAIIAPLVLGGLGYTRLRSSPVEVTAVTRGRAVSAVYATGTLEASSRRQVRARSGGLVVALLAQEGQTVRRGELLARIDPGALTADVQRGRVELRAALDSAGPDAPRVAALRADAQSVTADLELAARDLDRTERLSAQESSSQSDLDRARARKAQLEARLLAKRAELRTVEAELSTSSLRTRAQLDALLSRLLDTEVRAPIDGVILKKTVEPGEVVARDALLFRLGRLDEPRALLVEAFIDEADAARVRAEGHGPQAITPGSRVGARFYARPDEVVPGTVVEIATEADRERRSLLVKVRLERLPANLRVGMSAELNIVTDETEGVLVVPTAALDGDLAWVVREGHARRVQVERGLSDLERTEIRVGLKEGEPIVTSGTATLKDGQRVSPRKAR